MQTPKELKPALPRLDGVDVLRGISILAVILLHIWIRFHAYHVVPGRDWPPVLSHFVWRNGGNGVTIFFAVSGFLITLTSLRRFGSLRAMLPATFYRIRFARIMPLLVLLLAVLSALHLLHVDAFVINAKHFTLPRALFAALTFHLNWLETARQAYLPACWTVLWSLSIEEMFYLFFPLACVLLRWKHGVWLWMGLALALVAMGPFARVVWNTNDLAQENSYLAGMATIALGCVTAWVTDMLSRRGFAAKRTWLNVLLVAGWAIVLLILIWPTWQHIKWFMRPLGKSGTDDTLLALGTCLVMLASTLRKAKGRWWSALVRWFGRHSYEVYLSHEFVVILGIDAVFAHWFPHGASRVVVAGFVVGMVAVTAPLGWALAKFFSEPMNRWLRGAGAP